MARKSEKNETIDVTTKKVDVLNRSMEKTRALAKEIEASWKGAGRAVSGASGAGGGAGGNGVPSLVAQPTFSGGGMMNAIKGIGSFAMGAVGVMSQAMPSVTDAVNNQLITSNARFYGYSGNAGSLIHNMMKQGTSTDSMDAARAMAYGNANGLTSGLGSYSAVMGGSARMSNLLGSQEAAMRATVGMNQAGSVNMMRMAGINVRDNNGEMRDPNAIFKDFYNFAIKSKGRAPTKAELAKSLQSGNAFSNMLDQFFGKDTDQRNAMQKAALQFAGGGDLSRESLEKSGALTAAVNSQSGKNASEYGALEAATKPLAQGFTEANNILIKVNDQLAKLYTNSQQAQWALKQLAKGNTLAADKLGQAGISAMGVIANGLSAIGNIMSGMGGGKIPGLGGGGGEGGGMWSKMGGFLKNMNPLKRLGLGALTYGGLELLQKGLNATAGKWLNEHGMSGVTKFGNMAFDIGEGAATAFVATGNPWAAVGGAVAGGVTSRAYGRSAVDYALGTNKGSGLGQGADTYSMASRGGGLMAQSSASSASGTGVVGAASSQLGVPYSWGGGSVSGPTTGIQQGAKTTGFDCSGLMVYAYAKLGVTLPRTAAAQQKCGKKIKPEEAVAGDMLFNGEPAHHVVMYIGNGKIIEAPYTGSEVRIRNASFSEFDTAARVLNPGTGGALPTDVLGKDNGSGGDVLSDAISGIRTGGISNAAQAFGSSSSVGYDPRTAMSGGGGLGLGASTSTGRARTASTHLQTSYSTTSTGRASAAMEPDNSSGNGQTINYGGVTFEVKIPGNAKIDEKILAKQLKTELKTMGINLKVANS